MVTFLLFFSYYLITYSVNKKKQTLLDARYCFLNLQIHLLICLLFSFFFTSKIDRTMKKHRSNMFVSVLFTRHQPNEWLFSWFYWLFFPRSSSLENQIEKVSSQVGFRFARARSKRDLIAELNVKYLIKLIKCHLDKQKATKRLLRKIIK